MCKNSAKRVAVRLLSVAVIAGLTSFGTVTNATTTEDLKKAEYGTGDTTLNYGWEVDPSTNSEKLIKDAGSDVVLKYDSTLPALSATNNNQDLSDTTIIGNYIDQNVRFLENQANGKIGTLDLTVINANLSNGQSLISNNSNTIIDNIKGNFANITSNNGGNLWGGTIGNTGSINNIKANFIGNEVKSSNRQSGGSAIGNFGKIGDITGDFIGNYAQGPGYNVTASRGYGIYGGAIFNYQNATIGNITGNFIGNHADSTVAHSTGGAIYNDSNSTIGDIKGNFIGNYSVSSGTWAFGGAIENYGKIGDITGDFIGNYSKTTGSSNVNGGTISNRDTGYIGNITGNFVNNSASAVNNVVGGGVIGNYGIIKNITGDFSGNISRGLGVYGGVIYNEGSINDIKSNFYNNETNSKDGLNGAVISNFGTINSITGTIYNNISNAETYNYGTIFFNEATINELNVSFLNNHSTAKSSHALGTLVNDSGGKIEKITGDFINNEISTTGTYAIGGAIYNKGTINEINGYFEGNTATAENGYTRGGAIAIQGGQIETIKGDFVSNFAYSENNQANGGAIFNLGNSTQTANITSITGNFLSNHVESFDRATGGAINNNNYSDIGSLHGDFSKNYAISTGKVAAARGGAIFNCGHIGEVISNFTNNYAQTNGTFAIGGAITNIITKTTFGIDTIHGNFVNNRAISTGDNVEDSYAKGGAIYNESIIGKIENSSFINNYAKSKSSKAQGGAIYTTKDLNIIAKDGYTSTFSGNYTESNGVKDQNAIYVDTQDGDPFATVTLNAQTNGKFLLNDNIDGVNYNLKLTGDKTGEIYINNDIKNANISQNGATTYLNEASQLNYNNSLAINNGTMNIAHMGLSPLNLRSFANQGTININNLDINPATETVGRIIANSYGTHTGTINVNNLNILADPIKDKTNVLFADSAFANSVKYNGTNEYMGKIYKYSVGYRPDTGEFEFIRGGGASSGAGAFNPAVLSAPVNVQAGANATVNETFKYVFEHADTFTQLPSMDRLSHIKANQYALSTDYNENLGNIATEFNNKAGWVRPYVTFEKMNLKNSPAVNATTYGTLIGFDSDFQKYKHGWTGLTTGYIGYNGSQLRYNGGDTTMNGGLLGLTQTFYKGNLWTALTVSAGATVGQTTTMYGKEDFTTLLAGVGSKTGYNFEFKEGKYIIQPIWFMSYTFANTFDYTNAAGVRINSDPMHSIMLNPSVRFITNTKNGWQPYASIGMVWNAMNESSVKANNVKLPESSIKPYVEYGVGLQKRFKDKYTAFGQAMIRNGGRNGIAMTFGLRWNLGKEGKPIEKVQNNNNTEKVSNNKTPRLQRVKGFGILCKLQGAPKATTQPGERKVIKQMTTQQKISKGLLKNNKTSRTSNIGIIKEI